jgi:hypothetical protein
MRITVRNNQGCLICGGPILCFEGYKCPYCRNNYHRGCLKELFFINNNNNNNNRCLICQRVISLDSSILFDIIKCVMWEILPGILLFGGIIGIFVFFSIKT